MDQLKIVRNIFLDAGDFKKSRHSTSPRVVLLSSFHAMTSPVIYYSRHGRQNHRVASLSANKLHLMILLIKE